MILNFNPDYQGEDGNGNPWLDRRVAYAYHVATDRNFLIDAAFLGDGKPSALIDLPWFSSWAPPQEELLSWPGYRADRDADIQLARELLGAAGYDPGSTFHLVIPDFMEFLIPGITEITKGMYEQATEMVWDIQPITVAELRDTLLGGTFVGSAPMVIGGIPNLDPTSRWSLFYVEGSPVNTGTYKYQPMEDLIAEMRITLSREKRMELAARGVRILLGQDEEHGLEGFAYTLVVGNSVKRNVLQPWWHVPDEFFTFTGNWHQLERSWIDVSHPGYQA